MRLLANLAWLLTLGEVDLMPVASRQLLREGACGVFFSRLLLLGCAAELCSYPWPCLITWAWAENDEGLNAA